MNRADIVSLMVKSYRSINIGSKRIELIKNEQIDNQPKSIEELDKLLNSDFDAIKVGKYGFYLSFSDVKRGTAYTEYNCILLPNIFLSDKIHVNFIVWTALHELGHLVYKEHDSNFFKLEDQIMLNAGVEIFRRKSSPDGYPASIDYKGQLFVPTYNPDLKLEYTDFFP